MRAAAALTIFVSLLAGCRAPVTSGALPTEPDAFAIVAESDRLAAADLWPAFEPRTIPVAIYDGTRTLLFRHPSPPDGFLPVAGHDRVREYAGRHPAVIANSSVELGGVPTGTLIPASSGATARTRAGVLLHELFHVHQRVRHPAWTANEAELFSYPLDDAGHLLRRRVEEVMLARALGARAPEQTACWTRAVLAVRRERFAALPAGAVAYERGTELNEGLATYVEWRATGAADSAVIPADGFAVQAVRVRGYRTGLALARLLDRFSATWRADLAARDSVPLDRLLGTVVPASADAAPCAIPPAEHDRLRIAALREVEALHVERTEQRRAFLAQPGWRLVVIGEGAPLFPQGFDPLNVGLVAPGELLHTRFVKLGNDRGTLELLGRGALTESAGTHPLFNGVRTVTITGLAGEPAVTDTNGVVTVRAEGLTVELRGAAVERGTERITLRMKSTP